MHKEETKISGVYILTPRVFEDPRGFFYESHNQNTFSSLGIDTVFVQDNHSVSSRNTLRGMHFQIKPGQAKLVRCTRGEILDVVVDMRPGSPTFKRWITATLSGENRQMIYIPVGCAHGFVVRSDQAEVLYKCSSVYDHEMESGFMWNDPEIGIQWPIDDPLLSVRDQNNLSFLKSLEKLQTLGR